MKHRHPRIPLVEANTVVGSLAPLQGCEIRRGTSGQECYLALPRGSPATSTWSEITWAIVTFLLFNLFPEISPSSKSFWLIKAKEIYKRF